MIGCLGGNKEGQELTGLYLDGTVIPMLHHSPGMSPGEVSPENCIKTHTVTIRFANVVCTNNYLFLANFYIETNKPFYVVTL